MRRIAPPHEVEVEPECDVEPLARERGTSIREPHRWQAGVLVSAAQNGSATLDLVLGGGKDLEDRSFVRLA